MTHVTTDKKNILCIVGTRPEAIKMAPVILALKNEAGAQVKVIATAQHRQMLDQVLQLFHITPDVDLDIMQPNQSLPELTARLLTGLDQVFRQEKADAVIAQGDTTTVLCAALAAFYQRIPFCHVEAGLRTQDLYHPFPEEMNRVLAARLARLHFAPTQTAAQALLKENIDENAINMTGNTVIDALMMMASRQIELPLTLDANKKLILVTAHRRENFGKPMLDICKALKNIIDEFPDVEIVYPVHPNPNVSKVVRKELGGQPRIILCEPLDYAPFIALMKKSYFLLTDSGGVQEEAPALGKPVLVLRAETERPEAVDTGVVKLVGTDPEKILTEARLLLTSPEHYKNMAKGVSPYGDGKAAMRIVELIKTKLFNI